MDVVSSVRTRVRSRVVAPGAAAVLVAAFGVGVSPAAAATLVGNDVSWPQCPTELGGYGMPMPPSTAEFVVIGLTAGKPFTRNPCLASQVDWARTGGVPATGYTMAAFPTAAQLDGSGAAGPWRTTTRAGRLANAGYAEGTYALETLGAVSFTPGTVWVDVEALPKRQPWPGGTPRAQAENRLVITGLFRALSEAGVSYGIYTNASSWKEITGGWWLPGIPVWATVGKRSRSAAQAVCGTRGVPGGPVRLVQWWDDTRDHDLTCSGYLERPPMPRPPVEGSELTGDWAVDLLGRRSSDNILVLGSGTGAGTIGTRVDLTGSRWGTMNLIDTPGDMTRDGIPDVISRQTSDGTLWLYPRSATGWKTRISLGTGWKGMRLIRGSADLTGDGRPDLVALNNTSGNLWLYPGTGSGTKYLGTRVKMRSGWGSVDGLVAPGDLSGDGIADLLVRQTSGKFWLYPGNGRGGLAARISLGTGWQVMDSLVGPGDLDGDQIPDLLVRQRGKNHLWLYPGVANGFASRVQVSSDWSGYQHLS